MTSKFNIVKALAETLKYLPSEFKEDYPASVPNYVMDKIIRSNNRIKTNLGYVKNCLKKQEEEIEKLKQKMKQIDNVCQTYQEDTEWWQILEVLEK